MSIGSAVFLGLIVLVRGGGRCSGLFNRYRLFQRADGGRNLRGGDDAVRLIRRLADDLQQLFAIGLQHDDVGGGAGFEFEKHRSSRTKDQWVAAGPSYM